MYLRVYLKKTPNWMMNYSRKGLGHTGDRSSAVRKTDPPRLEDRASIREIIKFPP